MYIHKALHTKKTLRYIRNVRILDCIKHYTCIGPTCLERSPWYQVLGHHVTVVGKPLHRHSGFRVVVDTQPVRTDIVTHVVHTYNTTCRQVRNNIEAINDTPEPVYNMQAGRDTPESVHTTCRQVSDNIETVQSQYIQHAGRYKPTATCKECRLNERQHVYMIIIKNFLLSELEESAVL